MTDENGVLENSGSVEAVEVSDAVAGESCQSCSSEEASNDTKPEETLAVESSEAEGVVVVETTLIETTSIETTLPETAAIEVVVGESGGDPTVVAPSAIISEGQSPEVSQATAAQPQVEANEIALVEALILASGEPLSLPRLVAITQIEKPKLKELLASLVERYKQDCFGIELVEVAEQFQFRTKAKFAQPIRELKGTGPRRLSAAALETLAIVAYRQPIVRSDMEQIRGVDVTPTLKTLLERGLVKIVGHQPSVGNPALYGTTDEFLKLFGLKSLSELPTLRDLKELENDPGEPDSEKPSEPEEDGAENDADEQGDEEQVANG